ncbi:MAG: hypothetical protein L3J14_04495 [Flavobacteriaceae bacterium]|nr:hypothetical protein [Flavobacteriaceae bacterium]
MNIKNLVLSLILIVTLSSCVFVEEIYVDDNGKGNYSFKIDMGEMMSAMGGIKPKDSLSKPEVTDTIIYFKDILLEKKDSISKLSKEEQKAFESLGEFKMHMQVDEAEGKMIIDINTDFNNLFDLRDVQKNIEKVQALQDKKGDKGQIPSNADITYSFKNKTFKRSVALKKFTEDEQADYDEAMGKASMFLEGSLYKIIYHFESDIKEVSYKGAQISDDKKTVTIEVLMDSLTKNPKMLDFEIKLE